MKTCDNRLGAHAPCARRGPAYGRQTQDCIPIDQSHFSAPSASGGPRGSVTKVETERVRHVVRLTATDMHMLVSVWPRETRWLLGLAVKVPWLGPGGPILALGAGCMDRLRKRYSQLVGSSFLAGKAAWALSGCMTTGSADYCMLVNDLGVPGQGHESAC